MTSTSPTHQLPADVESYNEVISHLLEKLSDREKDILIRRFKLAANEEKKHTLEAIGNAYNITRERVRQIQRESLKKLQEFYTANEVKHFFDWFHIHTSGLIKQFAGAMEENFLVDHLLKTFQKESLSLSQQRESVFFLLSHFLPGQLERIPTDKTKYHTIIKMTIVPWNLIAETIDIFVEIIDKAQKPLYEDEILTRLKEHSSYHEVEMKFQNSLKELVGESRSLDEIFMGFLHMSRILKKNLFHEWGFNEWNTISPKKINDKIYLILKKNGQPLHFTAITDEINKIKFDHKKACAATVHNELILDEKYVLVGRGIYALNEWGYQHGTVVDIISSVLKEKQSLSKENLIVEVNKQRMVKPATIHLALMDHQKFVKLPNNEYTLRQSE